MDNFCSSTFWDVDQLWNSPNDPDFTYCFEETALLWAPCSFLLLLTLPHLLSLWWNKDGKQKRKNGEYKSLLSTGENDSEDEDYQCPKSHAAISCSTVSVVKMTFCLFLLAISAVELVSVFLPLLSSSLPLSSFIFPFENANNTKNDPPLPILTVTWLSPAIRVAVFSYLALLIAQYRKHRIYSSGPLFLFTLFNALYSAISTRTVLLKVYGQFHTDRFYPHFNELYLVCRLTEAVFSVGLFLAMCFNEVSASSDTKVVDPHQRSGFLGRITFWWFTGMVLKGYKRPLKVGDMFGLSKDNSTVTVVKRFERKMKDETLSNKTPKKVAPQTRQYQTFNQSTEENLKPKPTKIEISLGRLILKAFWKRLLGVGILKLTGSCLMFANPIVLDYLMTFMSDNSYQQQPQWRGFFYAVLMFTFPLLESVVSSQHDYWMNVIVLRVKQCLVSTIYKKSLRLSTLGRRNYSTGEITNIMAVDSQKVTDFLLLANSIWAAPLQFGLAIALLWAQVGWPSLAGLVIMLLMLPVNAAISGRIQGRQKLVMAEKDRRSKLMSELLSGIKVLKLYAWERAFSQKVLSLRARECAQLYRIAYLTGSMFFAWAATPFLVGFFTFALYVLDGNVLDPNKAFVSLALFNIIKGPMGQLPVFLSNGATCLVSIRRLNGYLNAAELDPEAISHSYDPECAIRVCGASFTWNSPLNPTLKDINLAVPHGSLVAIVGTVGSGKSSLLSGILGDMEKIKGSVNVTGRIAYVPQQAWIQNASLKANVVFTSDFENAEEPRYQEVIRACCMEPDIAILADGDRTELGAKGINLSGGQKARISLARAVFSDADIYLLDDPLSAVDAHVGKRLFEEVIGSGKGLLKGKTRILVTHQVSILDQVDLIVVLKPGGTVSEKGTFQELMAKKDGDFAAFMAEHMSSVEEEEEEEEKEKEPKQKFKVKTVSEQLQQSKALKTEEVKKPKTPEIVGKLITEERAQTGAVKRTVYLQYIRAIGLTIVLLIFASMAASNVFQVFSSLWLSEWANDGLDPGKANNTKLRNERLAGYAAFGVGEIAASIFSSLALSVACIQASKRLHETMLERILLAPMAFFDTTPIGRILNRFTKDIEVADSTIVMNVRVAAMQLLRALVALFMISLETPVILGAVLPILVLYLAVQRLYISTSRQLKRLESTTRSPIYDHFSETVAGASSIRAYGVQREFIRKSNEKVDVHSGCFYASFTAARWLAVRMEFFGYSIVFLSALFAVLSRGSVSPGVAGLAITYSLSITGVLGMFVRASTDLETNIVSIERLIEYAEVESEAEYYTSKRGPRFFLEGWPEKGEIVFEHYQTRYRPGLELVVRDVSITIGPHEKVGVVGRTGAGKSSLTLALFRIIEAAAGKGRILVDGVDISQIGLFDLRSRLSIIPQDPVLFTGSLRLNLDPFEAHSDAELWHALELAHLKKFVQQSEGQLLMEVSESGENLSVGTRQLVCLARALLRKSPILVLDEATAAVDLETDSLIQETIRREFSGCTILTIAHRLKTVLDYDRILVLDKGQVVEYAPPEELLSKKESLFYAMARDAKLV